MQNSRAFTLSRHAEFISASSRYQNNKTLKQVQGDGRKGFTLIELLVVVLIIGILVAVALPQYQRAVEKSHAAQALTLLRSLVQAQRLYYMQNGTYASKFEQLDIDMPGWTGQKEFRNGADGFVSDTRSNADWSIQLITNVPASHGVSIGRIAGPYAGGGFLANFVYKPQTQLENIPILCIERFSGGILFRKPEHSYCQKIYGGKLIYTSTEHRFYELP